MKKNILYFLILIVIALTIVIFMNFNNLKGEETVENSRNNSVEANTLKGSYMKLIDKNGQLMKSYSEEEIKNQLIETKLYKSAEDENGLIINPPEEFKAEVKELSKSNEYKLYVFHSFSFSSNIPVGKNNIFFRKPHSIIIEPIEKFESMSIILQNSAGSKVGIIEIGNYIGGLNIPLDDFQLDDSYTIQLINNKQEIPIYLHGGVIIYD
ncbi:hypothetical protein [Psychrobacillus lasiicapitis]|uniref:Uncharacterized protein n=1 Tax=Psychrobacillus lasiicapitis TaxID=1636719 RepID=A0A544SQ23_9BACI|nr:hypothetical protein [Psychrobacillus lasiicapitis]TQR07306.1 hypothetical protein FG382_22500 [Psychrobacillus lasiicapitis]GGA50261.1 hypothetical protein GCM10011384_44840 [Psychrobacillus lasiicapitis]